MNYNAKQSNSSASTKKKLDDETAIHMNTSRLEYPFRVQLAKRSKSEWSSWPWWDSDFGKAVHGITLRAGVEYASADFCVDLFNSLLSLLDNFQYVTTTIKEGGNITNQMYKFSWQAPNNSVKVCCATSVRNHCSKKSKSLGKARLWEMIVNGEFRISYPLITGQIGEPAAEEKNASPEVAESTKEAIAGTTGGGSDRKGETIVTTDEGSNVAGTVEVMGKDSEDVENVTSTEKISKYDITGRWMALPSFAVTTSDAINATVWSKKLPGDLYSANSFAISNMPIKNFIYMNSGIEFKFVVNAPKFGCGRLIAAIVHDPYEVDTTYYNSVALQGKTRIHVEIDLSGNTEGHLKVPFYFCRPWSRTQFSERQAYPVRPALFSYIDVRVLVAYTVGTDNPTTVTITPFFRYTDAQFAAQTWSPSACAPVGQIGDGILGLVGEATGMTNLIRSVESLSEKVGLSVNCDKPVDSRAVRFVPAPHGGWNFGRGPNLATKMTLTSEATDSILTHHIRSKVPTKISEIARTFGYIGSFSWPTTSAIGTVLYTLVPNLNYDGRMPCPVEYLSSIFQAWSGPLEVEFSFVCNDFQQGAVAVSVAFGADSGSYLEEMSGYTKVFHLSSNQKTFRMTIPYIYDTKFRRRTYSMYSLPQDATTNDSLGLRMQMVTTMRVAVMNPLAPIYGAPSTITCLVSMRAGKNFQFYRPCGGVNPVGTEQRDTIPSFPIGFLVSTTSTASKRSIAVGNHKIVKKADLEEVSTTSSGKLSYRTADGKVADFTFTNDEWLGHKLVNYFRMDAISLAQYRTFLSKKVLPIYDIEYADEMKILSGQMPEINKMGDTEGAFNNPGESDGVTLDFSEGSEKVKIMVSSEQVDDVKDHLRTPVMIHHYLRVQGIGASHDIYSDSYGPYWLPVIPPTGYELIDRSSNNRDGTDTTHPYTMLVGVQNSRQAKLMAMYGQWRGNQIYHFKFWRNSGVSLEAPVYIFYIPHDGSMKFGARWTYTIGSVTGSYVTDWHIGTAGLQVECVIPSINPTVSIDVPYTHENEWCRMHCPPAAWNTSYTFRDKGCYNNGHLVLWTTVDTYFDVWWEAGDQFMVSAFNGIPYAPGLVGQRLYADSGPSSDYQNVDGQMPIVSDSDEDFQSSAEEEASSVSFAEGDKRSLRHVRSVLNVAKSSISTEVGNMVQLVKSRPLNSAMAVVAPGISMAMNMTKVTESVSGMSDKVGRLADDSREEVVQLSSRAKALSEEASNLIGQATVASSKVGALSLSVQSLIDTLNGFVDNFNIGISVTDLAYDIILVCLAKDLKVAVFTVFRVFHRMGLITMEVIQENFSKIWSFLKRIVGLESEQQIADSTLSFTDNDLGSFCGVILGMACTMVGLKTPKGSTSGFVSYVKELLSYTGARTMLTCVALCKTLFVLMKKAVSWVLEEEVDYVKFAKYFEGNVNLVNDFFLNSEYVMNPLNNRFKKTAEYRRRAFSAYCTALRLHYLIVNSNNEGRKFPYALARQVESTRRWCVENFKSIACSPVKFTPLGVFVCGDSGVGKSKFTECVLNKWCQTRKIGIEGANNVYTRSVGSEYVEGYNEQPVWMYDDFAQFNDSRLGPVCFAEVIQLGSTATFIPNRSKLELKEEPVNPIVMAACSNHDWPISNAITKKEAIWRRFQCHIEVRKKEGSNIPSAYDKTFAHMEFRIHKDYTLGRNEATNVTEWMNYNDIEEWLFRQLDRHLSVESGKVMALMNEMQHGIETSTTDPMAVMYELGMRRMEPGISMTEVIAARLCDLPTPRVSSGIVGQMDFVDAYLNGYNGAWLAGLGHLGNEALKGWKYTDVELRTVDCPICHECMTGRTVPMICEEGHGVCGSCVANPNFNSNSCPLCRSRLLFRVDETILRGLNDREKAWNMMCDYVGKMVMVAGNLQCVWGYVQMLSLVLQGQVGYSLALSSFVASMLPRLIMSNIVEYIGQYWACVKSTIIPNAPPDFDVVEEPPGNTFVHVVQARDRLELRHARMVADPVPTETCQHSILNTANMIRVVYAQGHYHTLTFDVPEKVCKPREGVCYWEDFEHMHEFLLEFRRVKLHECTSLTDVPYILRVDEEVVLPPEVIAEVQVPWYSRLYGTLREFFMKYWKWFLLLGGGVTLGWTFWEYISMTLFGVAHSVDAVATVESQGAAARGSGDVTTARQATRTSVRVGRAFSAPSASGQMSAPTPVRADLLDSVQVAVTKNMVVFDITIEGRNIKMNGLGLCDRFVLIQRHYVTYLTDASAIVVYKWLTPSLKTKWEYMQMNVLESDEYDLAVVYVPDINQFKNILHHMPTLGDNTFAPVLPSHGIFLEFDPNRAAQLVGSRVREIEIERWVPTTTVTTKKTKQVVKECLAYGYQKQGACGNVLLVDMDKPLVSQHFAGETITNRGFGAPLYQDVLECAISMLKQGKSWITTTVVNGEMDESLLDDDANPKISIGEGLAPIALVSAAATPFVNGKTNIVPSMISHAMRLLFDIESETQPAILSTKDPRFVEGWRSPLEAGVAKHAKAWSSPASDRIRLVLDLFTQEMLKVKPIVNEPEILTWSAAAVGIPGFVEYPSLRLDTSAGFPWCAGTKDKSKRWAIEYVLSESGVPCEAKFDPKFLEFCEKSVNERKKGVLQPTIFCEFLKDERRKLSKIKSEGGTRVIDGAPMDYSLIKRKYFSHYTAAYIRARFHMFHAIGINPLSSDWTALANHLLEVGNNIIAMDYTDFGPSIPSEWIRVLGKVRYDWNVKFGVFDDTKENWFLTSCLTEEIACAKYIATNVVVQSVGGSPSGDIGTAEQNSHYNAFMVIDIFFFLCPDATWQDFRKNIRLVVYGDDLIMSVSDDFVERFNAVTIHNAFAEHGIKCTDERKEENFPTSRSLHEVTFLKRNFVLDRDDGIYRAPLPVYVIDDMVCWIRKCVDRGKATQDNVVAALMEWSQYGREMFEAKREQYNKALEFSGLERVVLSFDECERICYGKK